MTKILIDKETVELALKRAFNFGQTYWQQADSEYTSHHKKADVTLESFKQLVKDTCQALEQSTEQEPVTADEKLARMKSELKYMRQSTEQEPVAWIHNFIDGGVSIKKRPVDLNRHPDRWTALYKEPMPCPTCEALARTVMLDQTSHDTQPQEAAPPQHVLMASYYKEQAAQEYKRGYADAMNWKVQNHLEHLPAKGEKDRALELLRRAENEMRYAGWNKYESDNTARNGVYEQIKEFLK